MIQRKTKTNKIIYSFILKKEIKPNLFNGLKMVEEIEDFVNKNLTKDKFFKLKIVKGFSISAIEEHDDDGYLELSLFSILKNIKIVINKYGNGLLYNIGKTVNGDIRVLKKIVKEELKKQYKNLSEFNNLWEILNKVNGEWSSIIFSKKSLDEAPIFIDLYKLGIIEGRIIEMGNSAGISKDALYGGAYIQIDIEEIKLNNNFIKEYRKINNIIVSLNEQNINKEIKEYNKKIENNKEQIKAEIINKNKRLYRGGIDNLNLYIDEFEDEKIYVPKNLQCLYKCIEKILTKENMKEKIEAFKNNKELTDKTKEKIIKIFESNEMKNNTLKQGKKFITPLEEIGKMLNCEIEIRNYNRITNEINNGTKYNKNGEIKIKLIDYEIKIKNIKENKKILCPIINSENIIENEFKGKHIILIKTNTYEKKAIKNFIENKGDFEIIDFSDERIDEKQVNKVIKESLKKLATKKYNYEEENEEDEEENNEDNYDEEEENGYINNDNIFTFDIETTESIDGYTHFKNIAEKCKKRKNINGFYEIETTEEDEDIINSIGKKAKLQTIQVLSRKELIKKEKNNNIEYKIKNNKSVIIFEKKENEEETKIIKEFLEYIAKKTIISKNYTKKGNPFYKREATVIGFNSSKFDLDVLLEKMNGIKEIFPKKQINTGGGLICFSIIYNTYDYNKKITIKTQINFIDLCRFLGIGTLEKQCKNFNISKEYSKVKINEITKIDYKTLKSFGEENLLKFEKELIKQYENTNCYEEQKKIESLMYLTIPTLMKLSEKQKKKRKYNGISLEKLLEKYDKNDVISLMIIYDKFYYLVKNVLKIELKKNFTAAGIAGNYLKDRINENYRFISNKEINWNILDKACFGGICFSRVNKFETSEESIKKIKEIKTNENINENEIIKIIEEQNISDIVRAIDYNGLYGSAFLMDYNWASENEVPEFIKDNKIYLEEIRKKINNKEKIEYGGYICADIKVNKNITIPILINKDKDGNLIYSNEDKNNKNVYTIQTIENAIKYNNVYIDKIHYILKYQRKEKLLAPFASDLLYYRLCYKLSMKIIKKNNNNFNNLEELVKKEIKKEFEEFEKNIKDEFTKEEIKKCRKYFLREEVKLYGYYKNRNSENEIKNFLELCSQLEQLFKLIANSMYGKTLERPKFTKSVIKECKECKSYCEHFDGLSKPVINGFVICEEYDLKKEIKTSRDIGCHVLSNSKEIVYNGMNIVNGFFTNNILYTDTDSFYCKEKEINKIEKSGITNNYLPFCLKTNEVELEKDKFSYITSLYSTGQKNKVMGGYFFNVNKFEKATKCKFTMKGFKSYNEDKLNDIKINKIEEGYKYELCDKFINENIIMNENDIKDLCTKETKEVKKIIFSWKRELGKGVIIDEKISRKMKLDENEEKYTIIKENDIIYRYPLYYVK